MRYGYVTLLLVFCSAVCAARVGQARVEKAPNAAEQVLINAERSCIAAAKSGDVAFFKRTLAADFSYVSYDGQLYERQDMLDQYSQAGTDIQPYDIKVVPAGEDVAIVTYNVVYKVAPAEDQGPPPRYQHFTTVWVQQAGSWKMKFQQMTAAHWGDW
jgi:hypothetical protein